MALKVKCAFATPAPNVRVQEKNPREEKTEFFLHRVLLCLIGRVELRFFSSFSGSGARPHAVRRSGGGVSVALPVLVAVTPPFTCAEPKLPPARTGVTWGASNSTRCVHLGAENLSQELWPASDPCPRLRSDSQHVPPGTPPGKNGLLALSPLPGT